MKGKIISEKIIEKFKTYLCEEEKSENTKEKYIRDVRAFAEYVGGREIIKETVITYKQSLIDNGYGKREGHTVYAKTREECEKLLEAMIEEVRNRIKAEKEQRNNETETAS